MVTAKYFMEITQKGKGYKSVGYYPEANMNSEITKNDCPIC